MSAFDTLGVSTPVSLSDGAGFSGSGHDAGSVSLTNTCSPYPTDGWVALSRVATRATTASGDSITWARTADRAVRRATVS